MASLRYHDELRLWLLAWANLVVWTVVVLSHALDLAATLDRVVLVVAAVIAIGGWLYATWQFRERLCNWSQYRYSMFWFWYFLAVFEVVGTVAAYRSGNTFAQIVCPAATVLFGWMAVKAWKEAHNS